MICLVGFLLFGFLGIFSATYREYTLDAFSCIHDKATGSPCETGFDERYRAWSVDQAMKVDMRLAGFVKNYFAVINWFLFLLMLVMAALTLESLYNLLIYGSCDPGAGCSINQGLRWFR